MTEYEDMLLDRDLQEAADHGVRGYCYRHRHEILDTCDDCDEERANPRYERAARILVTVDRKTLEADADEDVNGWEWVNEEMEKQARAMFPWLPNLKVEFIEWEDSPDEVHSG